MCSYPSSILNLNNIYHFLKSKICRNSRFYQNNMYNLKYFIYSFVFTSTFAEINSSKIVSNIFPLSSEVFISWFDFWKIIPFFRSQNQLVIIHIIWPESDVAIVAVERVVDDVQTRITKSCDFNESLHFDSTVDGDNKRYDFFSLIFACYYL